MFATSVEREEAPVAQGHKKAARQVESACQNDLRSNVERQACARRNSQVSGGAIAKEARMATRDQPGDGWTVVLRRQPARIVEARPEGGYTDAFELICCDRGDHADLDYCEVASELQRVRGQYPIAAGVAAFEKYLRQHLQPANAARGMMTDAGDRR
jgi:hypothetical protein